MCSQICLRTDSSTTFPKFCYIGVKVSWNKSSSNSHSWEAKIPWSRTVAPQKQKFHGNESSVCALFVPGNKSAREQKVCDASQFTRSMLKTAKDDYRQLKTTTKDCYISIECCGEYILPTCFTHSPEDFLPLDASPLDVSPEGHFATHWKSVASEAIYEWGGLWQAR